MMWSGELLLRWTLGLLSKVVAAAGYPVWRQGFSCRLVFRSTMLTIVCMGLVMVRASQTMLTDPPPREETRRQSVVKGRRVVRPDTAGAVNYSTRPNSFKSFSPI